MIPYLRPRHRLGGYVEFFPSPELAPFVESLWLHRTPSHVPAARDPYHRVLPDPALSLSFACLRTESGEALEPRLFVVGPVTDTRRFPITPRYEMVSVKFKIERAASIAGVDPWSHANRLDDADDAHLGWTQSLIHRLAETRCAQEALGVLAGAATDRIRRRTRQGPEGLVPRALDRIRHTAGSIDLERLSGRLGVSTRHVRRSVLAEAGMSPKRYARTLRFLHVITCADTVERPVWARLAAECGFADQSHLIRESRALSGLAPGELFRERRLESEMFYTAWS